MQHVVKLVILGRDGILNDFRDDHVKAPEEWFPIAGALEAVARLNHAGWHAVVATNQSGIGRGMIDMASVNAVHAHMFKSLMAVGGRIDAVFFCPHTPEDGCDCRKPQPGLMRDIGKRYGIDLKQVPMVADTLRDLLAAAAAGCEPHLVRSGRAAGLGPDELQQLVAQVPGTRVHDDLPAFAEHLLSRGAATPLKAWRPMIYLRSALYIVYLLVTLIPWALVAVVFSIFVRGAPMYWLCAGWLKATIWGAKAICGVHYRVQGLEHLPTAADSTAAVLLAPKHQSTWETFAFPAIMPHPLAYVFKRELLWIPFFGWAIGRMDMIHIDRSRRSEAWAKVLAQGKRLMAQGNWVIMFPEGTRAARGQKGEYKSGASRLAIMAGTPIVPIAVTSARCWPRKSWLLRPGLIEVSIGRPIPVAGRRPDELMREVEAWIEAEMQRLDPEAYPPAATAAAAP